MRVINNSQTSVHPLLLLAFLLNVSPKLLAHQPERVKINLSGSIIDTPCAIATSEKDQTIDFGSFTMTQLIKHKSLGKHKFYLNLVNCDLHPKNESKTDWPLFQSSFAGAYENGFFSVSGGNGISIQISDPTGNVAIPGKALPSGSLITGAQRLEYAFKLVSNKHELKPGIFHCTLSFVTDYF